MREAERPGGPRPAARRLATAAATPCQTRTGRSKAAPSNLPSASRFPGRSRGRSQQNALLMAVSLTQARARRIAPRQASLPLNIRISEGFAKDFYSPGEYYLRKDSVKGSRRRGGVLWGWPSRRAERQGGFREEPRVGSRG